MESEHHTPSVQSGLGAEWPRRVIQWASAAGAYTLLDLSTHIYPWMNRWRWKARFDWWWAFGHLAQRVPVFAGEWGGEAGQVQWGAKLSAYLRKLEMGFWAWRTRRGQSVQLDYTPTEFGALVRGALSEPGE